MSCRNNPSPPATGPGDAASTSGTPPPCPTPCTITSQTIATSPVDRTRLRIGVGEEVDLTVNPSPATWAITSGSGTLSPSVGSHATVRLTAGDTGGSVTVTATASGCSCTKTFTVVEVSGWTMIQQPGTNLKHRSGRPDCGWKGITYFHPDDVNFYRVEDRERDSQAVATGSFSKFNDVWHGKYPLPDRASSWFPLVRHTANGTTDDAPDEIYSGDTGPAKTGTTPPFTVGTMYFPITLQWRVLGSANIHDLPVIRQEHEIFADGRCESRKGSHTEHTMYNDATSS